MSDLEEHEHGASITVSINHATVARLKLASEELGRSVYDLVRTSIEETSLDCFRRRKDDPGRDMPS